MVMRNSVSTIDCVAITLRLPTELYLAAKQIAEARQISLNQLINEAVKKAVRAERLELAREGYAEYSCEDAAELEEGMAEWSGMLERDDAR
jgi:predicted transcriptional regulator